MTAISSPRRTSGRATAPVSRNRHPGRARKWIIGSIAIVVSFVVFLVPFVFVLLQAAKNPAEANQLGFSLPTDWQLWQNLQAVFQSGDGGIVRAFLNSAVLTVGSVIVMVVFSAMVGYVLQRRPSK